MVNDFLKNRLSKRTVLKGIGATAVALGAPAIVRAQTNRPDEIKLGALCSLTGAGAVFGNSVKNSFDLRVDELNNAGGLWGNGKGMISITYADDQSKPEVAVSELARLARDKEIVALPSLAPSASTIQATIEAERQQITYINMGATAKEIQTRGLKYTFSPGGNIDNYVLSYLTYTKEIVDQSGHVPERVAILYENKFSGPAFQRSWMQQYQDVVDWNLAGDYPYDPATSDFGPLVARLKADGIDFPVLSGYPQDTILLLRAMREQNYNPLAISGVTGGMTNIEFIDALGKGAEYVMGQAVFLHTLKEPGTQEFVEAYKARTGKLPDPLAGLGFNGFNGLLVAIRNCGNPQDRDAIRDAFASLDIPVGTDGIIIPDGIRIGENGANQISAGAYHQIRDGIHAAVLPAEYAAIEPVYPRPAWDQI